METIRILYSIVTSKFSLINASKMYVFESDITRPFQATTKLLKSLASYSHLVSDNSFSKCAHLCLVANGEAFCFPRMTSQPSTREPIFSSLPLLLLFFFFLTNHPHTDRHTHRKQLDSLLVCLECCYCVREVWQHNVNVNVNLNVHEQHFKLFCILRMVHFLITKHWFSVCTHHDVCLGSLDDMSPHQ